MFTDFVLNGEGRGEVGQTMADYRFDPGLLRPYFDDDRKRTPCVTINSGRTKYNAETNDFEPIFEKVPVAELVANGVPVNNATSLRKDEWIQIDRTVLRVQRQRLRAWMDLAAANSVGGFDGMATTVLEHETMSDPGEAVVDMDGMTESRNDAPQFQLEGLPLPITHSDFWIPERKLAVSRKGGTPLNLAMAEAATRRVAELVEKTTIGVVNGLQYGDGSGIYTHDSSPTGKTVPQVLGYTNYADRVTKADMTAPDGTNGTTVLSDWLTLREAMYAVNYYGPFMAYVSTNYSQFLDDEFKTNSDKSLRQRLLEIDGITDIRRLDFLTATTTTQQVLFVQMTPDVARAINGMAITTVQWPSMGGMRQNFKVMGIQVPQIRSDHNGQCGIGHGTTS